MNWLDLVSNLSGFMGTVLLSAGLLKSVEQIKDEEAAYWDSNPFKINGAIKSQPFYRYGLRFLIISFSIDISFSITELITSQAINFSTILLLSIALSSIGLLIIQWFEKRQENTHRLYKNKLIHDNFFTRLRHIHTDTKGLLDVQDPNVFESYKNNIISEFKDRGNFLNDQHINELNQLISDLEKCADFKTFHIYLEAYLKFLKLI